MAHIVRTLFSSRTVVVTDFRCDGCNAASHPREECTFGHELAITRRGAWLYRNARGEHLADPTRVMFFNGGASYDVQHPVNGGDRCTAFSFSSESLADVASDLGIALPKDIAPFAAASTTASAEIHLLAGKLHALLHTPLPQGLACEELSLAILERSLTGLHLQLRKRHRLPRRNSARHRSLARDAEIELARRFREPLHLTDLAYTLGCSPFHLARVFRQFTGGSIHQRVLALRLSAAFEELASTARHVGTIAHELGFSDHAHLSAAFARRYGETPSGVRRRLSRR